MRWRSLRYPASASIGEVSWIPDWRVAIEYTDADGRTPGEFGHSFFVNRHIDPRVELDWSSMVGRSAAGADETPDGCHVSAGALPPEAGTGRGGELYREDDSRSAHERDWDYLEETGTRLLDTAGVSPQDAPAVLSVFADFAATRDGEVYPSRHPVDVALHASYCDGKANLLAALCMVFGMPARTIQNAVHTMVEVLVDGRWTLVDNARRDTLAEWRDLEPDSAPMNVFPETGMLDAVFDDQRLRSMRLPAEQIDRYRALQPLHEPYINLHTSRWHFNQAGLGLLRARNSLGSGSGFCAVPSPETIAALYPNRAWYPVVAAAGADSTLVLNPAQGWFRSTSWIDRGGAIARRFYVGPERDLENARGAYCELALVEGVGSQFDPVRGGWELQLNGVSLGMSSESVQADRGRIRARLPLSAFEPSAVNELVLSSTKTYRSKPFYRMPDALAFWLVPDIFDTHGPAYRVAEEEDRLPIGPVVNTHSAWYLWSDTQ